MVEVLLFINPLFSSLLKVYSPVSMRPHTFADPSFKCHDIQVA